jgi:two-component system, NarL family, response regulator LiaR
MTLSNASKPTANITPDSHSSRRSIVPSPSPLPNPAPLQILIAEDDPIMQLALSELFEENPEFEIIAQVTDGYTAVETTYRLRPQLVLMDIGLPKLDGIQATQQLKATLPTLHIVMLTSHTASQEMIAALASGADAYCVKGTNLDKLFLAITCAQEGATYLDPQIARQVIENLKPVFPQPIGQLSDRELEVLKLLVEGKSNPEIAATLYISLSTAKAHVRNIMSKLAVDDRVQAAVTALRSGLV